MAALPEVVWNGKFARHFYTWPEPEVEPQNLFNLEYDLLCHMPTSHVHVMLGSAIDSDIRYGLEEVIMWTRKSSYGS